MKLALALLLNVLLLIGLAAWLRREYRRAPRYLGRWMLPTLALRLVVGLAQDSPDAQLMHAWGRALTAQFWARPSAGIAPWLGHEIQLGRHVAEVYEWSNTLFVSKLLALLNLASLGIFWLNGLYLSLACFGGCWVLVRALGRLFPSAPTGASVVAFLLWPSVVWWTAGITKEALVLGSGAVVVGVVLSKLYAPKPALAQSLVARGARRISWWLLAAGLAWLQVRLRYFFALPLLGSLLALAGVVLARRRGWLRAGWARQVPALLGGVVLAGVVAVAVGGEPVSRAFITSQLWQNYTHGVATSGDRPHVEFTDLQPTVSSMAQHFPVAASQALVRPWLGESASPRYLAAGLENLLLVGLLAVAAAAAARGRAGRLPPALVLALLLYCVVLAGLIGLSTPNLGTLHRYRAVLLPWLVWLLLQNDYARRLLGWLGLGGRPRE